MRLAPEGNIIIYPLFIILLFTFGYGYVFNFESILIFIIILVAVFLFCLNFFRDPLRNIPTDKNIIISPADGKVIKIKDFEDPNTHEKLKLISIFSPSVPLEKFVVKGIIAFGVSNFKAAIRLLTSLDLL